MNGANSLLRPLKQLGETLTGHITTSSQAQKERLEQVAKEIAGLTQKQEQAQEGLRKTVEQRLDTLRTENTEKLETIRRPWTSSSRDAG